MERGGRHLSTLGSKSAQYRYETMFLGSMFVLPTTDVVLGLQCSVQPAQVVIYYLKSDTVRRRSHARES